VASFFEDRYIPNVTRTVVARKRPAGRFCGGPPPIPPVAGTGTKRFGAEQAHAWHRSTPRRGRGLPVSERPPLAGRAPGTYGRARYAACGESAF
jgi:hypothetical protein